MFVKWGYKQWGQTPKIQLLDKSNNIKFFTEGPNEEWNTIIFSESHQYKISPRLIKHTLDI